MTWLHTWTGLLLGWVLFAIFVTGTATYFKAEITRWMQPELRRGGTPLDAAASAWKGLEARAPQSTRWFITLPDDRVTATTAFWQPGDGGKRFSNATLDPLTGDEVKARETRGGEFFYRFHFQLQLPHPWGRYLAGVAAMFMLVALITGVIAHRPFFKEFFTFRPERPPLRSFLDFHNVSGVLALPFYFLISYSALVIFMAMYMPWARQVLSDSPANVARNEAKANAAKAADKNWVTPAPVGPMLDEVARRWGLEHPTLKRIEVTGRGTENMTVTFTRAESSHISITAREQLRFDGVSGALLSDENATAGAATAVHGALYGLHLARFAGPVLRWMLFAMGLMGCALIATGLVMWTIKRRPKYAKAGRRGFGQGLVERLNIATIAGLPVAIAALFWANRLLPVEGETRSDDEVRVFLVVWAVMLVHPLVRSVARAWREQLWAGALLYGALPIVDAASGPFLGEALRRGDASYLGFHATMLFTSAALGVAAKKLGRRMQIATHAQPRMTPVSAEGGASV